LELGDCTNITGVGLVNLKGMPLTSLNLIRCCNLTDSGLTYLKGLPLTDLNLQGCNAITDAGLLFLKGLPLKKLDLWCCDKISFSSGYEDEASIQNMFRMVSSKVEAERSQKEEKPVAKE
jgi:hypothetical protein